MDAPLPQSAAPADSDALPLEEKRDPGFAQKVKSGVIWRSGSQLLGQLIAWVSTFLVIRMLNPSDYGLVAMTGVVLTFLERHPSYAELIDAEHPGVVSHTGNGGPAA